MSFIGAYQPAHPALGLRAGCSAGGHRLTCIAPALPCAAPPGCEPRHAIGKRLAESFTRDHRSATCGTVLSPSTTRRRCCAATSKASERGMATQGVATCEPKRGLAARSLRNAPGEARLPGVPRRGLGGGEGGSVGSSCWQHPPHSHWTSAPISQDCARQGAALHRGCMRHSSRGARRRVEGRG